MEILKARAKINLTLDVLGKRADGYHEVEMIMQSIDLYDTVILEKNRIGIELHCKAAGVPEDNNNIAYKAAEVFLKHFDIKEGVTIKIDKNIPVSAGLAGGSSNAAAVLRGLIKMFNIKCDLDEIMMLGSKLGSDVPFCIVGGCCLAKGTGTLITPVEHHMKIPILLAKPPFSVSTAETYNSFKLVNVKKKPDTRKMIELLKNKDLLSVAQGLVNVLETVTIDRFPEIEDYKKHLMESGALGALMSGSGPSVYGIFERFDLKTEDLFKSDIYKNTKSYLTFSNNERYFN